MIHVIWRIILPVQSDTLNQSDISSEFLFEIIKSSSLEQLNRLFMEADYTLYDG